MGGRLKRACLTILAVGWLSAVACDHGTQARIIRTYRQAEFSSSHSQLTRNEVTLTTSFELGLAYQVTSRRVEYVPAEADAGPPVDEHGELIGPKVQTAEDPDADKATEPGVRRSGGTMTAKFPSRLLRRNDLYYRWVVEYTNASGSTLDMRKSAVFRTSSDRPEPEAEDERVTS